MNIIIYVDKNCNFCKEQLRILKKNKTKAVVKDSSQMPNILKGKNGEVSVPKILFVHTGVFDFSKIKNNTNNTKNNKNKNNKNKNNKNKIILKKKKIKIAPKRKKYNMNNFGLSEISLRQYGKNYIPDLKTGGYTSAPAGTFGRDVNYDNNIIFSEKYNNNIRMNRPGGPEDYLFLNKNCNLMNGKNNSSEYGLYSDSTKPFKFGSITEYGGGRQGDTIMPKIRDNIFINTKFGKKSVLKKKNKNKKVIKEGTVLTLKRKINGKSKIKVKNN